MSETILTAENLKFRYDSEQPGYALNGVSMQVKRGEFVAVLGANGCGKSTLAKHFNAILLPEEGKVYVEGMDTADDDKLYDIRQTVGMVFQSPDNQIVATVVEEDVAFALENLGVPPEEMRRRVDDAMKMAGIYEFRERAPHNLSGGQKQRVAIARALASDPEILLCDEATSALDPQTTEQILELLKKLNTELGITIVLITHEMQVIKKICHSVTVLENGRVAESGKVYDIFANPKADVTRSFALTAGGLSVSGEALEKEHQLPGKVLKLKFLDNSAGKAIISRLSRDYGIDFNIINGSIETIDGRTLGTLVGRAEGDESKIEKAINDMSENGVKVGVI